MTGFWTYPEAVRPSRWTPVCARCGRDYGPGFATEDAARQFVAAECPDGLCDGCERHVRAAREAVGA